MNPITIPLDIDSLEIVSQYSDKQGNIILEVVSKNTHTLCHQCGKPATKRNGTAPVRLIRQYKKSVVERQNGRSVVAITRYP